MNAPNSNKIIPILETERLIFRPWVESDAAECYRYCSDPEVGRMGGWATHNSIEDSLKVIRDVFMKPEVYAIILKETGLPIGCIGLMFGEKTTFAEKPDECEIGYWLGVPYWGQGMMTEAVKLLLHHAFMDLEMPKVWAGYYDGNQRSKRVQEKCGFHFIRVQDNIEVPSLHEIRSSNVNCITRDEWMNRNLSE